MNEPFTSTLWIRSLALSRMSRQRSSLSLSASSVLLRSEMSRKLSTRCGRPLMVIWATVFTTVT